MTDPMTVMDGLRANLHSRPAERWLRDHESEAKAAIVRALQAPKPVQWLDGPYGKFPVFVTHRDFHANSKSPGTPQLTPEEIEKRRYWREHQDDLAEALRKAFLGSAPPTVLSMTRAFEYFDKTYHSYRIHYGVELVLIDADGYQWFEQGPSEWERHKPGSVTYDPTSLKINTESSMRYLLSTLTDMGKRKFRFGLTFTSHHVSVGSGGYKFRQVLLTTEPLPAPSEVVGDSARRQGTSRDAKDALIKAMQAQGWTYTSGAVNEYLTDPDDLIRYQIKARNVRRQVRYGKQANKPWDAGYSLGSVNDVLEKQTGQRVKSTMSDADKAKRAETREKRKSADEAFRERLAAENAKLPQIQYIESDSATRMNEELALWYEFGKDYLKKYLGAKKVEWKGSHKAAEIEFKVHGYPESNRMIYAKIPKEYSGPRRDDVKLAPVYTSYVSSGHFAVPVRTIPELFIEYGIDVSDQLLPMIRSASQRPGGRQYFEAGVKTTQPAPPVTITRLPTLASFLEAQAAKGDTPLNHGSVSFSHGAIANPVYVAVGLAAIEDSPWRSNGPLEPLVRGDDSQGYALIMPKKSE